MDLHHLAVIRRAALLLLAACAGPTPDLPDDSEPAAAPWVEAGEPLVVQVGEPLQLSAAGSEGTARWDLGDGTLLTGLQVEHRYERPGNLVAIVELTSADGRRATDTVRVTVHLPAAPQPARASSPIAVHDGVAWVAVPEAGHLAAITLATGAARYVPVCNSPRTVTALPDRLAVACEDDDAIAWLDPTTDALLATTPLPRGARPYAVLADHQGAVLVTAQGLAAVLRVTPAGAVTTVQPATDPHALAIDPQGRAWTTRFRAAQDHGAVHGPAGELRLEKDPGPDSDTANRGVPTLLHALALSPDGATLYVGATLANVDRGLWVEADGPPSTLTFETTVRATLRVVDTPTATERFTSRRQYDNHGNLTALALSPLGNWLWLAHQGNHTLTRVDAYTLAASGIILDAGAGIDALTLSDDGHTLYVHAWLDRELRAYDVSDPATPSPPLLWTAPTVATEPLPPDVLTGKRLFHDSRDPRLALHGYLACSTCHPDGRDDGLTWDFTQRGEGLRNTISLRGHGGTAMGPVHWTANFDEIQDFENDIRLAQSGAGLLTDADWSLTSDPLGPPKAGRSTDLDALAAYVSSLAWTPPSPFEQPEGGAELFSEAGCATCHLPDRYYTDSAIAGPRHDVGTLWAGSGQRRGGALDGIDTPTLLGSWDTAPYLHDGSAATIEAAILAHEGSAGLSEEEVGVLAGFVRGLPAEGVWVGW